MAEEQPRISGDIPAQLIWRVEKLGTLYSPGEFSTVPPEVTAVIKPAVVIRETGSLLRELFASSTSSEVETYARGYIDEHSQGFAAKAMQGFHNMEHPRAPIGGAELAELFDSAYPFKLYSDSDANEAYQASKTVFSMIPWDTAGLTPPRNTMQTFSWLRGIRKAVEGIASGSIPSKYYVRNNDDLRMAMAFFTTGTDKLPINAQRQYERDTLGKV